MVRLWMLVHSKATPRKLSPTTVRAFAGLPTCPPGLTRLLGQAPCLRMAWWGGWTLETVLRSSPHPTPSCEISNNSLRLSEPPCPHPSHGAPEVHPAGSGRFTPDEEGLKPLGPRPLTEPHRAASPVTWELIRNRIWPHPDPLNQNLHVNKIPGDGGHMKI